MIKSLYFTLKIDFMLRLSKIKGIKGRIKERPEDFIVEEIDSSGNIIEINKEYSGFELNKVDNSGDFAVFILQKRNWSTIDALLAIAKRLGRGKKSISYAGTKDRVSISTQLASIYGIDPNLLREIKIKDILINGAWRGNKVDLGSNLGNHFIIRIREPLIDDIDYIKEIYKEINGFFPNYFDVQRFGIRLNNARIGLFIMQNNLEEAMREYLTSFNNENNLLAVEARKRLKEEWDFKKALEYFPRYLKNERRAISWLAKYKNDYAGAFRAIPRGITIMFIHAVEALIFNMALELRIEYSDFKSPIYLDKNSYGFPSNELGAVFPAEAIIGYKTNEEEISHYSKEAMDRLGIKKEDFKIKSLPELSMKGSIRPILSPIKDFSISKEDNIIISFSIPSGSYATILLNEFLDNENISLEKFL
mgnify:CR=1 FL=1